MTDTHAHEPAEAVAAFCHTCKHCGVPIEPEHCPECGGLAWANLDGAWFQCASCKGTGRKRWVEVKI